MKSYDDLDRIAFLFHKVCIETGCVVSETDAVRFFSRIILEGMEEWRRRHAPQYDSESNAFITMHLFKEDVHKLLSTRDWAIYDSK